MLIGVDVGTTGVKAVAFDAAGAQGFVRSCPSPVATAAGRNEQSPATMLRAVQQVLTELAGDLRGAGRTIDGIGVTGQGEGLWALDESGRPLEPAMLWNDSRAEEIVEEWRADPALYRRLRDVLGTNVKAGATLALLVWEARHRTYPRPIAQVVTCKDMVRAWLTDEVQWELTDASCSVMDLRSRTIADDVLKEVGTGEFVGRFPPLVSSTEITGRTTDRIEELTGIPSGTPVAAGAIDIVATAVGAGVSRPGDCCVILGTTGMTFTVTPDYTPDTDQGGWEYFIDGTNYIHGLGTMAATPNQDLWLELLGISLAELSAQEDRLWARMEEGPWAGGLLYLPHVSEGGERAPFVDPHACGELKGFRVGTTKQDILLAVMGGVAMSVRACLEAAGGGDGRLSLTGGGARSRVWAQIVADCTGREVATSSATELGARGAALLVGIGMGAVSRFDADGVTYRPDPSRQGGWDALYEEYLAAQSGARRFWARRAERMSR